MVDMDRIADELHTANLLAYLAICEERGTADDTYHTLDRLVREGLGI